LSVGRGLKNVGEEVHKEGVARREMIKKGCWVGCGLESKLEFGVWPFVGSLGLGVYVFWGKDKSKP